MSYVPQKVSIYAGSLLDNVAVGHTDRLNPELRLKVSQLLEDVGLTDFMAQLPNGLDSHLSEMGSSLSGGQIQRIGIARALFGNPAIMVFDESTSSLDSIAENAIMELLLKYRKNKTLIFIAHRLSTVKSADRILYLREGRIVAQGDFEELRKLVPEFNRQVEMLGIDQNS